MHAVYLCHFCPFSPLIDREPQKSYYIFLPSIVSPYSSNLLQSCTWARTLKSLYLLRVPMQSHYVQKGEIVFVCTLLPLWSCYAPRAFAVFVYLATSKSLYTSRATLYSLYMAFTPMQSPFALNLKSLHHVTKPYAVSIVPESLCSLHSYKIPLQSPYIAPTSKVLPHHARLSVSVCSVYLCGLDVTFAPLRLALTLGERAVSGSI